MSDCIYVHFTLLNPLKEILYDFVLLILFFTKFHLFPDIFCINLKISNYRYS